MGEVQELHVHIKEEAAQDLNSPIDVTDINQTPPPPPRLRHWKWWLRVPLNITFVLVGQSVGTLLGRLYFSKGGKSKWMATFVQTAGFPILLIPLYFFPSNSFRPSTAPTTATSTLSAAKLILLFGSLSIFVVGDNMLYSCGLLYLPVSTYSLICATQLAFNVVFSFLLNSQKLTPYILNSVVLLTISASLLAFHSDPEDHTGTSKGKYIIGFLCTLSASAMFSLILSIAQLSFQKVFKRMTFSVVLEMQFYTSSVATCVCVVGLFASGEWRSLEGEMEGFGMGRVAYLMTLIWTAVSWQVYAVGLLGLVFMVSSLFSNVISTVGLPVIPILAVIFFKEKMNGLKVVAMLLAIWGFVSYIYQNYVDDSKFKAAKSAVDEFADGSVL